jgi:hypothetical protein
MSSYKENTKTNNVRKRRDKNKPIFQLTKKVKILEQSLSYNYKQNEDKNDLNLECDEDLTKDLDEDLKKDLDEDLTEDLNKDLNEKRPFIPPRCHCDECFFHMGENNDRQVCGKYRCCNDIYDEKEMLQIKVFSLRSSPYYWDPTFYGYPMYHNKIQKFIDDNYIEDPDEKDNIDDNLNDPNNLD